MSRNDSLWVHRSFILLWFARLASVTASQMLMVALGWQMYDLTGSAWDLGLVGLLQFLPALGALAMSLVLTRWPARRRVGPLMLAAVAVYGAATLVFGVSTNFGLSMAALAVTGAADMISVVIRQTLVQLETPDAMRGRVSAVSSLFIGASNQLGEFESGATAAWLGPVGSVVLGGVGVLVVAGLWPRLFPALSRRDALLPNGADQPTG